VLTVISKMPFEALGYIGTSGCAKSSNLPGSVLKFEVDEKPEELFGLLTQMVFTFH
jgi:hypothetical protein